MMRLVFATGNKGKLREAAEILGPDFELLSSAQAGVTEDVEETGSTLKENSIIKAQHLRGLTGLDCFADDTGLEVDALDGAPGVFTARFAGPACNFDDNMDKLLRELAARGAVLPSALRPSGPLRTARFRSVVTLLVGGEMHFFEGVMEGCIAMEKAGCGGFGGAKRVGFLAMNSHANALYASAPFERGSRNTTGVPMDGASETRTLRGISVSYTLSSKWLRTSAITSCVSFATEFTIVKTMPFSSRSGLTPARSFSMEPVMSARPSIARYSACVGTSTESVAARAEVMTRPSDGGQSRIM